MIAFYLYICKFVFVRRLLYILIGIFLSLFVLMGALSLAVSSQRVQSALVEKATEWLNDRTDAKVQISGVYLIPFSDFSTKLSLRGVYIESAKGDTMIYARDVNAAFSPLELITHKTLRVTGVDLVETTFNLRWDENGRMNLRDLIDGLTSKKKKKKKSDTSIVVDVTSLKLKNCRYTMRNEQRPASVAGSHAFNHWDMDVRDINATFQLAHYEKGLLDVIISGLRCREKSGIVIKRLDTHLIATGKKALFPNFMLRTACSTVVLDSVTADYSHCWDTIGVRKDSLGEEKVQKSFNVKSVVCSFTMPYSHLCLYDASHWVERFETMDDYFDVSCRFFGTLDNMHLRDFTTSWNGGAVMEATVDMAGLPEWRESYADLRIQSISTTSSRLQDLIAKSMGKPFTLPKQVHQLGKISYKGSISGYLTDLVAYGVLNTDVGNLRTDVQLNMGGKQPVAFAGAVSSNSLDLAKLMGEKSGLGKTSFALKAQGAYTERNGVQTSINGTVSNLQYRSYNYRDIRLDGNIKGRQFTGNVRIDDPNARAAFSGNMALGKDSTFGTCQLDVHRFAPYALHLTNSRPDLSVSGSVNADISSGRRSATDKISLYVNDLVVSNAKKSLRIDEISLVSNTTNSRRAKSSNSLVLTSPLVNASLTGKYTLSSLPQTLQSLVAIYLPSLFPASKAVKAERKENFQLVVSDIDPNPLLEVLESDLHVEKGATVRANYDSRREIPRFNLEAVVPYVATGKREIRNTSIVVNNNDGDMLTARATTLIDDAEAAAMVNAYNDNAMLNLNWNVPQLSYGSLIADATLQRANHDSLLTTIDIQPSTFTIADDQWQVHRSRLQSDFSSLVVNKFAIDHEGQYIRASGVASSSVTDSMQVNIRDVQLGYVMQLIGLDDVVDLKGRVTGDAMLYGVLGSLTLNLDAFASDFAFNQTLLGDAKVKSHWNPDNKQLHALAEVQDKRSKEVLSAEGDYFPTRDSMLFIAQADKLPISFLRPYLDGVLDSLDGKGTGEIQLFGSFKRPMMRGSVKVDDGSFMVSFLGTKYHLNDTIRIMPNAFMLDDIVATDDEGHTADVAGYVKHEYFKNISYNITVLPQNVQVLNLKPSLEGLFYGKAYASGRVGIVGKPGICNFNINVRTEPNTDATLSLLSSSSVSEATSFINYVDRSDTLRGVQLSVPKKGESTSGTTINLVMSLDATTDATVNLLTNETGDLLTATGSGTVTVRYNSRTSQLALGGLYEVENGGYTFTLEQLLQRKFTLRKGGTIHFNGEPTNAVLNASAVYSLPSVSLLDLLDESDLEGVARTNVPVNCLLHISGALSHPTIKFGLELPSDEELQRKILNIVSSDEIMNREMLSLLVLGTFYRPDYIQASANTSTSASISNSMATMAASSVSGQINSLLSQYTDKLSLGLNAHLGTTDQGINQGSEYEVALHYTPNNRLVINSNLGYRNDYLYTNTAADNTSTGSFIGDLDIEYKLTRSGKLRAKAYTHSADRYYYNVSGSAKTTQGVGLIYREEFNTWKGLFRRNFMSQAMRDSLIYMREKREREEVMRRYERERSQMRRELREADSLEARFDSIVAMSRD